MSLAPTVRLRLALLNMSVFAVLLGGGAFALYSTGQRYLQQHFDERLEARAESMANRIRVRQDHPSGLPTSPKDRLNPFRFPGYFFQIRTASGRLLERSKNLGETRLPFDADAEGLKGDGDRSFGILGGQLAVGLLGSAGHLRLVNIMRRSEADGHFILQVALSRRAITEQVKELRQALLSMMGVGLLLAGLASWLLARQALAPIGDIARVADELGSHDLTRRFASPRSRDEIGQMVGTINRMLDRLQSAFDSQGSFIANVSHEFKTPLAVLLGSAQVLLQRPRTEAEYRAFVDQTEQQVRMLSTTVEGLLLLSRTEANAPMPHAKDLSLNEVVMGAVHRSLPYAKSQQVRLVPQLPDPQEESGEACVHADAELLQVALGNLLRNAIRHCPPDSTVEVVVAKHGDWAEVRVQDQGPGIPEHDLERIFEKFNRGTGPTTGPSGAGLGLTIARSILSVHQGTLSAANQPGGGAVFTLRLPATVR